MRNLVVKNDRNRAATHLDRSKEPQLTVGEGLLDYFAESAENVAQRVYDNESVRCFIGETELKGVVDLEPAIKFPPLSEEDKENRVLRVEMSFTPGYNPALAEFMDSLANR